jgi:undecaprenyl-diphosphatase
MGARVRAAGRALALGAMHGPAELLPISSSGHIELIPWLLRWDEHAQADPEVRKAFEVALHAGTVAALLIALRGEVIESARTTDLGRAKVVALSFVTPAAVGFVLEKPIERHLGRAGSIAVGLIVGAILMAWADRQPQERGHEEARAADGFWLGVAQTCALVPGVSRNGATLTAARLRKFTRADSERLSRHVALPVIAGATALKLLRLKRDGLPEGTALPFALGAGASFLSTLGSTRIIEQIERDRPLLPIALYRTALGSVVLRRLWSERNKSATMSL